MGKNYQRRAWLAAIKENTGSHFLDSGGAMGRHWQRNKGLTIENAYDWTHRLNVDKWGFTVTLNVLHYLESNFVIDRARTARFHRYAHSAAHQDESWHESLVSWVKETGGYMTHGDNTYNHENWLSQDVLMHSFVDGGGEGWHAIATHNGADARGGYSKYYLCKEEDTEWEVWMTDGAMGCPNGHWLHSDGGSHWIMDDPYRTFSDDDLKVRTNGRGYWLPCPECGKKLSV